MKRSDPLPVMLIFLSALLGCEPHANLPIPIQTASSVMATTPSPDEARRTNVMTDESQSPRVVQCTWLHPQFGKRQVEVTVLSGDMIKVRLFDGEPPYFATIQDFDAPEIDQPFGIAAADRLAQLLRTENISAGPPTQQAQKASDEFQRGKATAKPTGDSNRPSWVLQLNREKVVSIAEVMGEEGLGWWNGQRFSPPDLAMRRAMKNQKGLWSDSGLIAPWVWRELTEPQKRLLK